jgi:hypothetical protein
MRSFMEGKGQESELMQSEFELKSPAAYFNWKVPFYVLRIRSGYAAAKS